MKEKNVKIVDLNENFLDRYLVCLDCQDSQLAEGVERKRLWYELVKDKGLLVKLALDQENRAVGMVQGLPSEMSFVNGENMLVIHCIWIPPKKRNAGGKIRGKGIGVALLKALEEEALKKGYRGVVAWGMALPFWMKASWFKKQGYRVVEKKNIVKLMYKQLIPGNESEPKWLAGQKPDKPNKEGSVSLLVINNGWCSAMNMVAERALRVAAEFSEQVKVTEIDTSSPEVLKKWGDPDALYLDGKNLLKGPPPSEAKIRKQVVKAIKKRGL